MLQLLVNLAWTPVFFGEHEITLGLYIIVLLDMAVLVTIVPRRASGLGGPAAMGAVELPPGRWRHVLLDDERVIARGASHHRWLWPSELDLLARIAGLVPHQRLASWTGDPFTGDSRNCIAVYRKPGGASA